MSELQALQAEIRELKDRQAILELKHRYLDACDAKRPAEVLDCFAEGEVDINFGHIGQFQRREDFVAVFEELGCHDHIVDLHHAQNPVITFTGPDSAEGRVGLHFHSLNTRDKTAFQLAGQYRDAYQRIDGQWRIVRSHFKPHWVQMRDFSGDADVVTYAGNAMPG
ncbi:nuclear transport factor 2 family protein [Parahaliea mediterranea]|uniref:nuclear transport factor 2 family protein n=1 Tax=Parahaliea mediterranea TaxID=651086 RepID=UPI000E2F4ABD|nr:nuclear transport factor 2 family protein [Parahaliea mediterranea]